MSSVCGIVLAAGAGRRYGGPKALARTETGEPWLARAVGALEAGGCDPVLVALGAERAAAAALVPPGIATVDVADWADGLSATVHAALVAAQGTAARAALLVPVDTPDMPAAVVARLAAGADDTVLRRAVYRGSPGHPVVIGRRHFSDVAAALTGDRGAGAYLQEHGAEEIECADLWTGADIDARG